MTSILEKNEDDNNASDGWSSIIPVDKAWFFNFFSLRPATEGRKVCSELKLDRLPRLRLFIDGNISVLFYTVLNMAQFRERFDLAQHTSSLIGGSMWSHRGRSHADICAGVGVFGSVFFICFSLSKKSKS
jgi:hypothetical protein